MKNRYILTTCLCLTLSVMVKAQFTTGQKVIGGQLHFSNTNYEATNSPGAIEKNINGGVSLSLSRFTSPTLLRGIGVQYAYSDARYNNTSTTYENKNHVLGAFIELTKLQPLAKKVFLSFSGTGGINYSFTDRYQTNNTKTQMKGYGINLMGGMGIWYQLTNRFVLTGNVSNLFSVSYGHGKTTSYLANNTTVVEGKNNSFSINTGLTNFSLGNIGFGVKYLLKK